MPLTRPLKVFLCHASADKPAVRGLSHRLAAEGWIDPWLDEEKLSFGQHWTTAIEEALDAADIVLIFLSHNSVQKEGFVQRELNYAWELSLEKPHNVIFLIPFRLDNCEVPRFLSSKQWGDYFGDKEESTYKILLRSLKQRYEQKLHLEAEEQKQREFVEKVAREKADRESKEKAERDAAEKAVLPVSSNDRLYSTIKSLRKVGLAKALDLNFSPLYRINGQEPALMPGLLAMTPPRKAAPSRDQDRLIVYLLLTGTASFSTAEYMQLASEVANAFYQTPGTLTSAMRKAAESVNHALLERNMSTSGHGQYTVSWLALGTLREKQFTLLMSGPVHGFIISQNGTKHIYEPTLSGKGLGVSQTAAHYFTQVSLQHGERIVLCGNIPIGWETVLNDHSPASLEVTRSRLLTVTSDDLNAIMMQVVDGTG